MRWHPAAHALAARSAATGQGAAPRNAARRATTLLTLLLLSLPAAAAAQEEEQARDAIAAVRAREIARASDPDGAAWLNQTVGIVLLPASLVFLLYLAAKGRR
jgi:hypothetical protein